VVVGPTTVRLGLPADGGTEVDRLRGELQKRQREIDTIQAKLSNAQFTAKAPTAVVDRERARLAHAQEAAQRLRGLLGESAELG